MTAEELGRSLAQKELGFPGYLILRNLTESPESVQWLAQMLGSSLVNVYGHINRMEDRGLLAKARTRGHKSLMIGITEAGKKLLEEVEES